MADYRLGDEIDDYCIKCKRLTNHLIVSLMNSDAAKVRCRTCYSEHDYRHEVVPPTKRELKKQELFNQALAAAASGAAPADGAEPVAPETEKTEA